MIELHPSIQALHERFHVSADEANKVMDEMRLQPSAEFQLTLSGPEAAAVMSMLGQSIGNGISLVSTALDLGAAKADDPSIADAVEWAEHGLGVLNELVAAYVGNDVPDHVPDWFEQGKNAV